LRENRGLEKLLRYGTKIGSGSLYCVYTLLFCEFKVVKLNWCVLGAYWVSGAVPMCVQQSQNAGTYILTLLEVIAQADDFGFGREVVSLRRVSLA